MTIFNYLAMFFCLGIALHEYLTGRLISGSVSALCALINLAVIVIW